MIAFGSQPFAEILIEVGPIRGAASIETIARGRARVEETYLGFVKMEPGASRKMYIGNDTDFKVTNLVRSRDQSPINDAILKGHLVQVATKPAIVGASNASPIVITTASNHGMASGDKIFVEGVTGNAAANGAHTITVLTATTFSLDSSTGSGAYVSGGTWWKGVIGAIDLVLTYIASSNGCYVGTIPGTISLAAGTYLRFVTCSNYSIRWGPTPVDVRVRQ